MLESVRISDAIENGHPGDDLPEIPFSIFLNYEREKSVCWEFYISEMRNSHKYMFYCTDEGRYEIRALTKFGDVFCGARDIAPVDRWLAASAFEWLWPGFTYTAADWAQFLAKWGVIDTGQVFATRDPLALAWINGFIQPFYTRDGRQEFIALPRASVGDLAGSVTFEQSFWTFMTYIRRAAEFEGLFVGSSSSKYHKTFPSFPTPSEFMSSLQVEAAAQFSADAAKSAQFWPELPGFSTQYYGNLGVLVPDGMVVDAMTTTKLFGYQAPVKFVVCSLAMPFEEQMMARLLSMLPIPFINQWNAHQMLGGSDVYIPGGPGQAGTFYSGGRTSVNLESGGLFASLLVNNWAKVRVLIPALKMFGRMNYQLPTWAEYESFANSKGFETDTFWHRLNTGEMMAKVQLSREAFDMMIDAFTGKPYDPNATRPPVDGGGGWERDRHTPQG